MNYASLCKTFNLPSDFTPPGQLAYDDLIARPLTRFDLKDDLAAVNSSIDIIQKTHGGSWPEAELSEDFDFLDLVWHEREFRDRASFAYVVHNTSNTYVGCFYLYPIGIRTKLSETTILYDCDASWWVSKDAYEKLYAALQRWLADSFPFQKVYYSNKETPA